MYGQAKNTFYLNAKLKRTNHKSDAFLRVEATDYSDSIFFKSYLSADDKLYEEGAYKLPGSYLKFGRVKRYWPNGNIRYEGNIQDGAAIGKWNYYDEAGIQYSSISYSNGVYDGDIYRFYLNGLTLHTKYFLNKKHGKSEVFDANHQNMTTEYYYLGKPDSNWVDRYVETRKLKSKQKFNKGIPVYDSAWWQNGKLKYGLHYDSLGRLDGKYKYFDAEGIQCRFEQYKNGKLIKYNCFEDRGKTTTNECPPKISKAGYTEGEAEFNEHVKSALEYPADAMQMQITGDVILRVLVKTDGSIGEIEPENLIPLGYGLEFSCIKLIKEHKKFVPAMFNGIAIEEYLNVPFHFTLQQTTDSKGDEMDE